MAALDWSQCPAVESVPGKVSGAWVLKDTRMPVSAIFENLKAGAAIDDIMEWFDGLDRNRWRRSSSSRCAASIKNQPSSRRCLSCSIMARRFLSAPGYAVPLIAVSPSQINAIAPQLLYFDSVAEMLSSVSVQVEVDGVVSAGARAGGSHQPGAVYGQGFDHVPAGAADLKGHQVRSGS